jgi:hypothetical protein
MAADIANAHVQELTKLMSRLAVTEAQQRRKFFETQLEQTQAKLTQAEIALKQTGIASPSAVSHCVKNTRRVIQSTANTVLGVHPCQSPLPQSVLIAACHSPPSRALCGRVSVFAASAQSM